MATNFIGDCDLRSQYFEEQRLQQEMAKQRALLNNQYAGGLNQAAQIQPSYISTTTPTPPNKVLLLCR